MSIDCSVCDDLYFDKTRMLDGYNLKGVINGEEQLIDYDKNKSGYDRWFGSYLKTMSCALKYINATATVKATSTLKINESQLRGELEDLQSNIVDLGMNPFFLGDYWRMFLYPLYENSHKIITLKDNVSHGYMVLFTFSLTFFICFIIFCFISVICLKCILDESLSDAVLEFLRMFLSIATLKTPKGVIGMISFIIIIVIAFAFNSYIFGEVIAITAKPDYILTIDSAEDVAKLNYTINGLSVFKNTILEEEIVERYHQYGTYHECIHRFLKHNRTVCMMIKSSLLFFNIYESETIHISKDDFSRRPGGFVCATDSPLMHKLNWILMRIKDGGIVTLFNDVERHNEILKHYEVNDYEEKFGMKEFILSFYILIAVWVLAFSMLLTEIIFNKMKKYAIQLVTITE